MSAQGPLPIRPLKRRPILSTDALPDVPSLVASDAHRASASPSAIWAATAIFNGNATVLSAVPVLGSQYQDVLARIFALPAQFLAQHLFHVPPPGNQLHPTGSGDTAINWIAVLILFCLSIVATAIWTALDRRRPNYRTLSAWLRFLIRFTVAMGLVSLRHEQSLSAAGWRRPPPPICSAADGHALCAHVAAPWLFIGFNPLYEILWRRGRNCWAACCCSSRRTALAGALFSATFVVTNVLLYQPLLRCPGKALRGSSAAALAFPHSARTRAHSSTSSGCTSRPRLPQCGLPPANSSAGSGERSLAWRLRLSFSLWALAFSVSS